jgi:hypothetical protein
MGYPIVLISFDYPSAPIFSSVYPIALTFSLAFILEERTLVWEDDHKLLQKC